MLTCSFDRAITGLLMNSNCLTWFYTFSHLCPQHCFSTKVPQQEEKHHLHFSVETLEALLGSALACCLSAIHFRHLKGHRRKVECLLFHLRVLEFHAQPMVSRQKSRDPLKGNLLPSLAVHCICGYMCFLCKTADS